MSDDNEPHVYTPRAGSVPERAIAYLKTLAPGTIVETTPLATAIEAPANGMMSNLGTAVRAGVLKLHKVKLGVNGARTNGYSVPPNDPFDSDEERNGKPLQRTVPAGQASAATKGVASVFDLAAKMGPPGALPFELVDNATPPAPAAPAGLNWRPGKPLKAGLTDQAADSPAPEAPVAAAPSAPSPPTAPAADRPAPPLECALWSNGELWLRIDGASTLVLDRAMTKHLVHYLDRMATEPSTATT